MAFSYGPYTFDAQADGDAAAFDWTDQTGTTTALQNANTAGRWCHDTNATTSSNVGPDHGAGGDPDGYAYTEMSSQAIGDIWYVTFGTALDASANAITFEFKWCARGNDAEPLIQLETSENGGTWTQRGSDMGFGDVTIPGTSGVTTWWQESIDLTDLVSHSSTEIRIKITCNGATFWHNDIGIDEVEITGTDLSATPAITNADNEDFYIGETGVTITGTDFQTEGANSRVRIDSSAAGTGTSQTQVDTSWSDTSIDFTVSQGSLSYGTNYLFVRNHADTEENAVGYEINLYLYLSSDSLSDTSLYDGQTGVELTGEGFGSSQVDGLIVLDGIGGFVNQTITAWTDTKITFTVDTTGISNGAADIIMVRENPALGDLSGGSSAQRLTAGLPVTVVAVPVAPEIDSVNEGTVAESHEDVSVKGTLFEAVQGTGQVDVCPTATYASAVEQTVVSWSATEIVIDMVRGGLSLGTLYMFVTNDTGDRNATGFPFIMVADPITDGLYKTTSFQSTINDQGLTTTIFLIKDE